MGTTKRCITTCRRDTGWQAAEIAVHTEAVNKSESGDSPLLASPQGGVAVSSKNIAEPPKQTQPGWFSLLFSSENLPGLAVSGCFAMFFESLGVPSLR